MIHDPTGESRKFSCVVYLMRVRLVSNSLTNCSVVVLNAYWPDANVETLSQHFTVLLMLFAKLSLTRRLLCAQLTGYIFSAAICI
jgi:hypothetical protein